MDIESLSERMYLELMLNIEKRERFAEEIIEEIDQELLKEWDK
ncbi:hypothetical protein [Peribacillus butanolivorans]|nr:hypothetical protein [Peribacillus butanolivorans]